MVDAEKKLLQSPSSIVVCDCVTKGIRKLTVGNDDTSGSGLAFQFIIVLDMVDAVDAIDATATPVSVQIDSELCETWLKMSPLQFSNTLQELKHRQGISSAESTSLRNQFKFQCCKKFEGFNHSLALS